MTLSSYFQTNQFQGLPSYLIEDNDVFRCPQFARVSIMFSVARTPTYYMLIQIKLLTLALWVHKVSLEIMFLIFF